MTPNRHPLASLFLAGALLLPTGGAFAQSATGTAPGAMPDQPGTVQAPPSSDPQAPANNPSQAMNNGVKPKPRGGCLKYGAAGAVGGHFAHHHAVLGAVGGCAVGAYVKHRSKKRIAAGQQP